LNPQLAPAIEPLALALDGEHLYWATPEATVGRVRLDGSSLEPGFIDISGNGELQGLALDGAHIFIADSFATGTVYRANIDGSGLAPILFGVGGDLFGVAAVGGHVYWSNDAAGAIGRANLDGSEPEPNFITGLEGPETLAADGAHLYWTDRDFTIGRANLDGSAVDEQLVTNTSTTKSQNSLQGLAVDGGHIYWSSWGSGVDAIGRANLDGSGADPNFITFATGVTPSAVAVDGLPLPTTTSLSCTPATVLLGASTTCTATVTSSPAAPGVPSGSVSFAASAAGTFTLGARCALTPTSASDSSCQLTFVPGGLGSQTLSAAFSGDNVNAKSDDSTTLTVDAPMGGGLSVKPSNAFRLSKLRFNRRRGTATMIATVPGPGAMTVAGRGIRRRRERAPRAGVVRLLFTPSHRTRAELLQRGTAKVRFRATYSPDGGDPRVKALTIRLKLRPR
jgi:hypothetical protein